MFDSYHEPYKEELYTDTDNRCVSTETLPQNSLDATPDQVMADVSRFFAEKTHHRPAEEMLDALAYIPRTAVSILKGEGEPKYYLSPIDTGVGKSVTLAHTIRRLNDDLVKQTNPGVMICLGRYTQIEDMITKMGLAENEYAVLVAAGRKEGRRGLGSSHINQAPILLTTHSMIEKRLIGRTWAEAEEFHYLGKPRQLRVWDESILPGLPITIPKRKLYLLMGLRIEPHPLRNEIEGFTETVAKAENQQLVTVPEFADNYDLHDVRGRIGADDRRKIDGVFEDLWRLSGRPAHIIRDGDSGNTLVQYELHLPDDILPMLILDASARVRSTYRLQANLVQNVVWLKTSNKRYDNVTIRVRQRGSGKRTFGKWYWEDLREIAKIILQHPTHKTLVLHHKADYRVKIGDVPTDLDYILKQPHGLDASAPEIVPNVEYCSWGRHNATNDYSDRDLVIVASMLYYPRSTIEAIARISAKLPIEKELPEQDRRAIERGEMMSDLLQGLSRGSMRNLDGNQAQDFLVYLSLAKQDSIKPSLNELFPGAKVLNGWGEEAEPVANSKGRLSDQQREALEFIHEAFRSAKLEEPFADIYNALQMKKSNFSSRVINSPYVKVKFDQLGYRVEQTGRSKVVTIRKDVTRIDAESMLPRSHPQASEGLIEARFEGS